MPWVRWVTDWPTSTDMVSRLLTSRSPNSVWALKAASTCSACWFMVSRLNIVLSASLIVRPGACR